MYSDAVLSLAGGSRWHHGHRKGDGPAPTLPNVTLRWGWAEAIADMHYVGGLIDEKAPFLLSTASRSGMTSSPDATVEAALAKAIFANQVPERLIGQDRHPDTPAAGDEGGDLGHSLDWPHANAAATGLPAGHHRLVLHWSALLRRIAMSWTTSRRTPADRKSTGRHSRRLRRVPGARASSPSPVQSPSTPRSLSRPANRTGKIQRLLCRPHRIRSCDTPAFLQAVICFF